MIDYIIEKVIDAVGSFVDNAYEVYERISDYLNVDKLISMRYKLYKFSMFISAIFFASFASQDKNIYIPLSYISYTAYVLYFLFSRYVLKRATRYLDKDFKFDTDIDTMYLDGLRIYSTNKPISSISIKLMLITILNTFLYAAMMHNRNILVVLAPAFLIILLEIDSTFSLCVTIIIREMYKHDKKSD
jgi:hypothetical protein